MKTISNNLPQNMMISSAILAFTILQFSQCNLTNYNSDNHPIVHTKLGSIRGNRHDIFNSSVNVFWSIPFAKPPVGELRFQHAQRPEPWSGILDGTQFPNACFQLGNEASWTLNVPESEDCLYLTVYVPLSSPANSSSDFFANNSVVNGTNKLPVLFYIYGGGFIRGTTTIDRYNGSTLAVLNDIIVVTTSYRLGAFGYLFAELPDAPGNAAVFDQLMALQWVHDNIGSFGGDPEAITVMGSSAGAYHTGHLILSPFSRGLFSRAILNSGTPNSVIGIISSTELPLKIVKTLGNAANCTTTNSSIQDIVSCLKELPASELDLAQEAIDDKFSFRPIADGYYLENITRKVYEEAAKKNMTVIIGVTQNEGNPFLVAVLQSYGILHIPMNSFTLHQIIHSSLNEFGYLNLSNHQREAIRYVYSNWEDSRDHEANRLLAGDFIGDSFIICPANEFGYELSQLYLNVYYYVFNHNPSKSIWPKWVGAGHAADIEFIFGHPVNPDKGYTEDEYNLSYRIVKTFGNFVKYGVPSFEGEEWPKYSLSNKSYVEMKTDGNHIRKGPRAIQCALWHHLLPKLTEQICDTVTTTT